MVHQAHLVHLDHLALVVHLGYQAVVDLFLELFVVLQVGLVPHLVPLDLQVHQVHQDLQARLALLGH